VFVSIGGYNPYPSWLKPCQKPVMRIFRRRRINVRPVASVNVAMQPDTDSGPCQIRVLALL
jgi:hypothetical protein